MSDSKKLARKYMPNLTHHLSTYADEQEGVVNALVEVNSHRINKYERDFETGHMKLDRVGYSSISYPTAYGEIPKTLDDDMDPLDILIVNVQEELIPGSQVEARIIGIMKFDDGGERDDKVIAVLNDDKRSNHINSLDDLGEHFQENVTYYFEHYKDLKKPGTCKVHGFSAVDEAREIIEECIERYNDKVEFID